MKSLSSEFNITRSRKTLKGMLRCGRGAREREREREGERVLICLTSKSSIEIRK